MDFFLQDIRDKTEKYQNELLNRTERSKPLASLELIRNVLTDDLKSVIITNLKFKAAKIQYVTRITRDKVELSEKNLGHDSHVIFQFDDGSIFYNKKKMNDLFRLQFTERIQTIIFDIEKSKTTVYEEIAPKVPYPQGSSVNTTPINPDKDIIPSISKKSVAELEMEAKRRRLKELADQKRDHHIVGPTHSSFIEDTVNPSQTLSKSAELRKRYSPSYKVPYKAENQGLFARAGTWLKELFS